MIPLETALSCRTGNLIAILLLIGKKTVSVHYVSGAFVLVRVLARIKAWSAKTRRRARDLILVRVFMGQCALSQSGRSVRRDVPGAHVLASIATNNAAPVALVGADTFRVGAGASG